MARTKAFRAINRIIEISLIGIFGLLVVDVLGQVFSRKVLGESFTFTEELARFALIWLTILGAAYLNGQREHLAMDFWLNKLSPDKKARRLRIIELVMAAFALVVMVGGGGFLVYTTLRLGQKSPAMNIPLGFVYAIVPLSGLLIIFYSFHNYFRHEH